MRRPWPASIWGRSISRTSARAHEFLVRVPLSGDNAEGVNKHVTAALAEKFGADKVDVQRVEAVGPRVGPDLRPKAVLAILFAT